MKIAVIYGGQGSQEIGMGKALYESSKLFKDHVDYANRLLDFDLKDMMFHQDEVNQTKYAQIAIYVMNAGLSTLLKEKNLIFYAHAGLSLGEYNALLNSQVFSFEEGLQIIKHRALYMQECSLKQETKMLALLGNLETVHECIQAYDDVYIANYNTLNQYVVGGSKASIESIMKKAKSCGIKRAVLLETSGAFHTPYMDEAKKHFEEYLKNVKVNEPKKPLYLNVSGKRYQKDIKQSMINQITAPVKFYDMIFNMVQDGVNCFIEVGPKPILKSMVKKLVNDKLIYHVSDLESLNQTILDIKELTSDEI
ncbi:MAG: ACP S-malonyltransferase [Candidatus Izemoplasmataceae bacterium]